MPTRIRLTEPIGQGASATVWRARDVRDGIDIAVKVLSAMDPAAAALRGERLEREARALARLAEVAGVVHIREVGVARDGTSWLVMDLAAPGSLRDRMAEARRPDVAPLGARLATALAHAHALGIVHGDVAPANVLFDSSGSPLLADFGMGAILDGGEGAEGVAGCTPAYAAPERLFGARPDTSADVYALAATLWHVHRGAPPDHGTLRAVHEPLESLELREEPEARASLDVLLSAALAPDPRARPTAAELARELGASAEDLPAPVTADSRRPRAIRRRR